MTREATAILAQSITRTGSKQTYYTARLMVDKELVNDFFRAYAYFRWVDDIIDIESRSTSERISFIKSQRALIDGLYKNRYPNDLSVQFLALWLPLLHSCLGSVEFLLHAIC